MENCPDVCFYTVVGRDAGNNAHALSYRYDFPLMFDAKRAAVSTRTISAMVLNLGLEVGEDLFT